MKVFLIILLLVGAALVTGALVAGPQLREALGGLSPEPPKTEVRVEVASVGKLIETIQAPGGIEPYTDVQIAAEVSARVIELPVDEGDEVLQGDVICKLDDKDLKAALISAKAIRDAEEFRLRSSQASLDGLVTNLEFARIELERVQVLFATGDESERVVDNTRERVENLETSKETTRHSISVAESSLAAVEADIERAEDALNNTVIVSPMDGVITLLNIEVGEIVTGSTVNPGTVMMTIADLSRMILNAEVAESDIAKVVVGQKAQLHINAYQEEVFGGTVRQIALQRSISNNGTGYFKTEVEIDLQGRRIYSGLIANVDIEIASHEGIVVPYQSIVVREVEELPEDVRKDPLVDDTKSKISVVYRVVDGKAICTPVKPGSSDLTHRVVLKGLEEGETILTGPYKVLESIKHDDDVSIMDESPEEDDEAEGAEPTETAVGDEEQADDEGTGEPEVMPDEPEGTSDESKETGEEAAAPEPAEVEEK